jgi:hypothetical protein
MTRLSDIVCIDRRFARSARIDADLNGTPPLVGYVLQASVAKCLNALAVSQSEHLQGAFTWTGPYGGGKSSAALLVANLVAGKKANRTIARRIAGKELTAAYSKAFPDDSGAWKVMAVTGSRASLRETVTNAAAITFAWTNQQTIEAAKSDAALISAIKRAGSSQSSGTLIILDELGKLLEYEALGSGDIHLLQDLAEHSTRSKGRLVIIGILHQAFDQYAARASRDARQEWAKVQGRFHDIGFLSGADETVALVGQAITSPAPAPTFQEVAKTTAQAVAKRRPTEVESLSRALAATWPLNPVTALLLGPVSRARFAQNERSVFGFLSSAEPNGFQEFLAQTEVGAATYGPDRLWDYLASNFGMALAAGHDGGRFSLAFEAIERAGAKGGPAHVAITKAAAALEFFRNGSGLALADDFLSLSLPGLDAAKRGRVIADLLEWAILIKQPRLGGYALFAGSDFDLEEAIVRAMIPVDAAFLEGLPQRVGFGFAAAKRHYFATGALRIFEISLQLVGVDDTASQLAERVTARAGGGSGHLVVVLGNGSVEQSAVEVICKGAAKALKKSGFVIALGAAAHGYALRDSAAELAAVERVLRDCPQLEGDRIARRELAARHSTCIDRLHRALESSLSEAKWWLVPMPTKPMRETLAIVASALADAGYPDAPVIKSELLQRDRPSSNSMAALRELCHAMVARGDQANLGITGFPAELGLYLTIIKPFGLHREEANGRLGFCEPCAEGPGKTLWPAWRVLEQFGGTGLGEVFRIWAAPPFGIKAGVMPALALAYMLANQKTVAVYVDDVFQTGLDDVTVDRLLQRAADFKFKTVDRTVREAAFLVGLAAILGVEDASTSLPVAQALFQRFEALPVHAARTTRVSELSQVVRRTVLKSRDPETLLFTALPGALGNDLSAEAVYNALLECEATYPSLLAEMRRAIAKALGVVPNSFSGLTERAAAIKGLTNDYAFEAFADRVAALEGDGDLEGALSVLLHRPAHGWSDRDREQALTEIARYGRRFRELEALAVVRDRRSHTETLALIVGLDPLTPPLLRSFELTDTEKHAAALLADRVLKVLKTGNDGGRLQLAALARAVAALAAESEEESA